MDPEHSILAMDISVKASMSDIKSTDNLFSSGRYGPEADRVHVSDSLLARMMANCSSSTANRKAFPSRRPPEERVFRHHARIRASSVLAGDGLFPCFGAVGGRHFPRRQTVRAVRAGRGGTSTSRPRRLTPTFTRTQSPRRIRLRRKGQTSGRHERLARSLDDSVAQFRLRFRANGRPSR